LRLRKRQAKWAVLQGFPALSLARMIGQVKRAKPLSFIMVGGRISFTGQTGGWECAAGR
jgi:hypothetical protein